MPYKAMVHVTCPDGCMLHPDFDDGDILVLPSVCGTGGPNALRTGAGWV